METVVEEDSPLASYLEAKGETCDEEHSSPRAVSGAPSAFSFVSPSRSTRVPFPARRPTPQHWLKSCISSIQDGYARAVSSTLGKADNERFLEHFRYIIIASQLLNEYVGAFSKSYSTLDAAHSALSLPLSPATLLGASVSTLLGFIFVWLIHWTRDATSHHLRRTRFIVVTIMQAITGLLLYAYVRRHWLKYLRQQAVDAISKFVEEVQLFESSSSSILKQIQEIEVVSRGYQISSPLPPVSRLEIGEKPRTCRHSRQVLQRAYESASSAFLEAMESLRYHVNDNDFHRFLDVYNIKAEDAVAVRAHTTVIGSNELESLAHLRELQYRFSTLRRLLLCSLLSIPATGRKEDRIRWRTCVMHMVSLGTLLNDSSQCINKALLDQENPPLPSPMEGNTLPPSAAYDPHHVAFTLQLRTLHAKLHLVRSDVGRLTSIPSSVTSNAATRDEFAAVGVELQALLDIWEQGRAALDDLVAEKPKSVNTDGGGLGIVLGILVERGEGRDGQSEALRLLNGALPASPPLSAHSGSGDEILSPRTPGRTAQEEGEVFEAMSQPKQRPNLMREQRIVRMQEDRDQIAKTRERREASSNMIKELQAVINLRPSTYRRSSGKPSHE